MSSKTYARREGESEVTWCERVLSCPLIGPEPIKTIASVSGAHPEMLMIVRNDMIRNGWSPPPSTWAIGDAPEDDHA